MPDAEDPVPGGWSQRTVVVDGVRTGVADGGAGPPVVLLHGGEFGASSRWSWEHVAPLLRPDHRVLAIDWLGYGATDKVHDFVDPLGRMIRHLARTLEVLDVTGAHVVGNSMGGALALLDAASDRPLLPARSVVSISGGGPQLDGAARAALVDYDGSPEGMRRLLAALVPSRAGDDAYVAARHAASVAAGAWEAVAAARFRRPDVVRPAGPRPDATAYERIAVPVLLVAGADDPLKPPGWERDLAARIPGARSAVLPGCGHCPNIERPAGLVRSLRAFWVDVAARPTATVR